MIAFAILAVVVAVYSIWLFTHLQAKAHRLRESEMRALEKDLRTQLFIMSQENLKVMERTFERSIDAVRAQNLEELHIAEVQKERARAEIKMWEKAADAELQQKASEPPKPTLARGINRATGEEQEIDLSSGLWSPM